MPPRYVTLAILAFWLAMTIELVRRESAPRFREGEPPPFTIDLTDEVGAKVVNWEVLQKDHHIGVGFTQIKRQADGTFELYAQFKLEKPFQVFKLVDLNELKASTWYTVTDQGKLVAAQAQLKFKTSVLGLNVKSSEFKFSGEVRDEKFHPQLAVEVAGVDVPAPKLEPFAVPESGNILNPMHLVNRINGLREGQSWAIPLMDPLRSLPNDVKGSIPVKDLVIKQVIATVTLEDLRWNNEVAPCFKIVYAKPGDEPMAATWVRQRDGIVLEQWAGYESVEYTLRRSLKQ